MAEAGEEQSDADSDVEHELGDADYDYLLSMPMWNLTKEKKDAILKKKDEKHQVITFC